MKIIDNDNKEYEILRWDNVKVGDVVLFLDETNNDTPCIGKVEFLHKPTECFILNELTETSNK